MPIYLPTFLSTWSHIFYINCIHWRVGTTRLFPRPTSGASDGSCLATTWQTNIAKRKRQVLY